MLTIKLNTAGSILISQAPAVTIGLSGSEVYRDVMAMTGPGVPPDVVQTFPQLRDGEGQPLNEGGAFTVPRPDAKGAPVAVLITDIADDDVPEASGTSYQFLYAGDEAEILNDNGVVVQSVR